MSLVQVILVKHSWKVDVFTGVKKKGLELCRVRSLLIQLQRLDGNSNIIC